ncbi:MAG: tRNA (adenosine(37)-N6)-threonylcarbamoyltransferase complex ATPase subunit type 1 TsaE [Bacteroidales bacterium]|nr:tRNA (adenosine(37)-N6)-threonylcarbamoyltransferase complex ATPase subunit type 1 TsaE [Lentimicrobiaceae bacterium]MDD5696208.1 tRNA (adenosine(37)-N6)-threonylcarbamoyltransferase complex ATPase subunit type 1 TsaE [Bacteroidales bacterium]
MDTLRCDRVEDLDHVSLELLYRYPDQRVFGFYGQLGAGKTALIKNLCKQLGVVDLVSSPTFSIINEYRTRDGEPVYHMDFYRLTSHRELLDIGAEEYFYSGFYCLIEWPEKFEELLPDNCVYIKISVDETNQCRIIQIEGMTGIQTVWNDAGTRKPL